MIIQHNIAALNAHRNLGINNSATGKNLEKLSSGYRINRAADDAAGLAISEKMRGQIRGLGQAEMNVDHAINLIQTAEGGLQETHAILHRMRELAVQSSNGTYDNDVDRANLEKELQALKSEIDRIAASTHYNGINLLDGTTGGINQDHADEATFRTSLGITANLQLAAAYVTQYANEDAMLIVRQDGTIALQIGDTVYNHNGTNAFVDMSSGVAVPVANYTYTPLTTGVTGVVKFTFDGAGLFDLAAAEYTVSRNNAATNSELVFQIGANGTADQRVGLGVDNMSTAFIGYVDTTTPANSLFICDITVADQDDANDAIAAIDAAVNQVSSTRADLGALQNRMEHTLSNLGVTKENLTAAESTIRDVDMAKEMMEYTKNTILVQAAQAMLAQAQTLPQGVLNLLQ